MGRLVLDLAPDLWRCSLDPTQFEAAVLNMLVNARDALSSGGTVTISTRNFSVSEGQEPPLPGMTPGSYVQLSIGDTGVGMSPETLNHAFEPFFTTKEVGKGSGLGLSQVFGFVKQSGGYIQLDSRLGQGTTVRIYLPKLAESDISGEKRDSPVARHDGRETILVVEDNEDVLEMALETLVSIGYQTLVARNGPEALALLEREQSVDLLFSDVVMPMGMSGIELARHARQRFPGLRVLLTTGYAASVGGLDDQARDVDVLLKPYRKTALAAKIKAVLERT
jgi:CheY-like chemotaxis protein